MVFLVTKAALAASIIGIGITIGALSYLSGQRNGNSQPNLFGRSNNPGIDSTTQQPQSTVGFGFPFLFSGSGSFNLFATPPSTVPEGCNCKLLSECSNFRGGALFSFRLRRTCGFQGFRRKVCCDDDDPKQPISTPPSHFALHEVKSTHIHLNSNTGCKHISDSDCDCNISPTEGDPKGQENVVNEQGSPQPNSDPGSETNVNYDDVTLDKEVQPPSDPQVENSFDKVSTSTVTTSHDEGFRGIDDYFEEDHKSPSSPDTISLGRNDDVESDDKPTGTNQDPSVSSSEKPSEDNSGSAIPSKIPFPSLEEFFSSRESAESESLGTQGSTTPSHGAPNDLSTLTNSGQSETPLGTQTTPVTLDDETFKFTNTSEESEFPASPSLELDYHDGVIHGNRGAQRPLSLEYEFDTVNITGRRVPPLPSTSATKSDLNDSSTPLPTESSVSPGVTQTNDERSPEAEHAAITPTSINRDRETSKVEDIFTTTYSTNDRPTQLEALDKNTPNIFPPLSEENYSDEPATTVMSPLNIMEPDIEEPVSHAAAELESTIVTTTETQHNPDMTFTQMPPLSSTTEFIAETTSKVITEDNTTAESTANSMNDRNDYNSTPPDTSNLRSILDNEEDFSHGTAEVQTTPSHSESEMGPSMPPPLAMNTNAEESSVEAATLKEATTTEFSSIKEETGKQPTSTMSINENDPSLPTTPLLSENGMDHSTERATTLGAVKMDTFMEDNSPVEIDGKMESSTGHPLLKEETEENATSILSTNQKELISATLPLSETKMDASTESATTIASPVKVDPQVKEDSSIEVDATKEATTEHELFKEETDDPAPTLSTAEINSSVPTTTSLLETGNDTSTSIHATTIFPETIESVRKEEPVAQDAMKEATTEPSSIKEGAEESPTTRISTSGKDPTESTMSWLVSETEINTATIHTTTSPVEMDEMMKEGRSVEVNAVNVSTTLSPIGGTGDEAPMETMQPLMITELGEDETPTTTTTKEDLQIYSTPATAKSTISGAAPENNFEERIAAEELITTTMESSDKPTSNVQEPNLDHTELPTGTVTSSTTVSMESDDEGTMTPVQTSTTPSLEKEEPEKHPIEFSTTSIPSSDTNLSAPVTDQQFPAEALKLDLNSANNASSDVVESGSTLQPETGETTESPMLRESTDKILTMIPSTLASFQIVDDPAEGATEKDTSPNSINDLPSATMASIPITTTKADKMEDMDSAVPTTGIQGLSEDMTDPPANLEQLHPTPADSDSGVGQSEKVHELTTISSEIVPEEIKNTELEESMNDEVPTTPMSPSRDPSREEDSPTTVMSTILSSTDLPTLFLQHSTTQVSLLPDEYGNTSPIASIIGDSESTEFTFESDNLGHSLMNDSNLQPTTEPIESEQTTLPTVDGIDTKNLINMENQQITTTTTTTEQITTSRLDKVEETTLSGVLDLMSFSLNESIHEPSTSPKSSDETETETTTESETMNAMPTELIPDTRSTDASETLGISDKPTTESGTIVLEKELGTTQSPDMVMDSEMITTTDKNLSKMQVESQTISSVEDSLAPGHDTTIASIETMSFDEEDKLQERQEPSTTSYIEDDLPTTITSTMMPENSTGFPEFKMEQSDPEMMTTTTQISRDDEVMTTENDVVTPKSSDKGESYDKEIMEDVISSHTTLNPETKIMLDTTTFKNTDITEVTESIIARKVPADGPLLIRDDNDIDTVNQVFSPPLDMLGNKSSTDDENAMLNESEFTTVREEVTVDPVMETTTESGPLIITEISEPVTSRSKTVTSRSKTFIAKMSSHVVNKVYFNSTRSRSTSSIFESSTTESPSTSTIDPTESTTPFEENIFMDEQEMEIVSTTPADNNTEDDTTFTSRTIDEVDDISTAQVADKNIFQYATTQVPESKMDKEDNEEVNTFMTTQRNAHSSTSTPALAAEPNVTPSEVPTGRKVPPLIFDIQSNEQNEEEFNENELDVVFDDTTDTNSNFPDGGSAEVVEEVTEIEMITEKPRSLVSTTTRTQINEADDPKPTLMPLLESTAQPQVNETEEESTLSPPISTTTEGSPENASSLVKPTAETQLEDSMITDYTTRTPLTFSLQLNESKSEQTELETNLTEIVLNNTTKLPHFTTTISEEGAETTTEPNSIPAITVTTDRSSSQEFEGKEMHRLSLTPVNIGESDTTTEGKGGDKFMFDDTWDNGASTIPSDTNEIMSFEENNTKPSSLNEDDAFSSGGVENVEQTTLHEVVLDTNKNTSFSEEATTFKLDNDRMSEVESSTALQSEDSTTPVSLDFALSQVTDDMPPKSKDAGLFPKLESTTPKSESSTLHEPENTGTSTIESEATTTLLPESKASVKPEDIKMKKSEDASTGKSEDTTTASSEDVTPSEIFNDEEISMSSIISTTLGPTTTSVPTTAATSSEPPFKVQVKVGPYDSRSLFSSHSTEEEKALEGEISNVVSQLLLTTHKNFGLLPTFVECAGARGRSGRRKTRVLHFDTDNYPWMARVGYREPRGVLFPCAGTIISRRYVLTSAHCALRTSNDTSDMEILLEGAKNAAAGVSDQPWFKYKVEEVIPHYNYNNITRENDLALIRLAREIPPFNGASEVKPICLPFEDGYGVWDSLPGVGETAFLGGWGYGLKNMAAKIEEMQEAAVTIWPTDNCTHLYRGDKLKRITPKNICAYGNAEKDSCRGDAGGPLMALMTRQKIFFQIGIVSYGPRCGYGVPGVYTRVNSYLSWILDSMRP